MLTRGLTVDLKIGFLVDALAGGSYFTRHRHGPSQYPFQVLTFPFNPLLPAGSTLSPLPPVPGLYFFLPVRVATSWPRPT